MPWITLMDSDDILQARRAGGTGYWWTLASTDLVSSCGEDEAAEISGSKRMPIMGELSLVPGKAAVSEEQRDNVLKSCGYEDAPDTEEAWVEMAHTYGLRIPVNTAYGSTDEIALRRVLKEACVDLDGAVNHLLNRPVNRIGQTGREHLDGDMDSCLKRAKEGVAGPQPGLAAGVVRMVSQKNLSSECMMVQIWGLDHCKTCEYRHSADCGGQNIRKTGKNENGLTVPVS